MSVAVVARAVAFEFGDASVARAQLGAQLCFGTRIHLKCERDRDK